MSTVEECRIASPWIPKRLSIEPRKALPRVSEAVNYVENGFHGYSQNTNRAHIIIHYPLPPKIPIATTIPGPITESPNPANPRTNRSQTYLPSTYLQILHQPYLPASSLSSTQIKHLRLNLLFILPRDGLPVHHPVHVTLADHAPEVFLLQRRRFGILCRCCHWEGGTVCVSIS